MKLLASEPLLFVAMFAIVAGPEVNVTLCAVGPGNDHSTLPLTAIFEAFGLNVSPLPLAVTLAVNESAVTVGLVVAVFVAPLAVREACTTADPGFLAITRPAVVTDTAVSGPITANVAFPSPVIGALFWSRGVAMRRTVSPSTRAGFVGATVSDVNTSVG